MAAAIFTFLPIRQPPGSQVRGSGRRIVQLLQLPDVRGRHAVTAAKDAIEILSEKKRLEDMGVSARASAQARFCASKIIPMYEDYYREVLERAS